jgi:hypothetical protein
MGEPAVLDVILGGFAEHLLDASVARGRIHWSRWLRSIHGGIGSLLSCGHPGAQDDAKFLFCA